MSTTGIEWAEQALRDYAEEAWGMDPDCIHKSERKLFLAGWSAALKHAHPPAKADDASHPTPSTAAGAARITGDKDRENPVEGAHPMPDAELVEALKSLRREMELRFTGAFAENAVNTISAATEALADRKAGRDAAIAWQPIETAPRDGTWVQVAKPGEYRGNARWAEWENGNSFVGFTHWQPLPTPPAIASGEHEVSQ